MPAYVVADVDVSDPARYEVYRRVGATSVVKHGGRFLVRGGRMETLEGDWHPRRVVVIEFPTFEAAKAWFASDDYAEARKIRHGAAVFRAIAVDGVAPPT